MIAEETHQQPLPFRLLNKKELAAFLGCTTRTVDRMVATGKLPYLRVPYGALGKTKTRFDSRDIDAWVEQCRPQPEKPPVRKIVKRESTKEYWAKHRATMAYIKDKGSL